MGVEGTLASDRRQEDLDAAYERHFADLARLCRALGAGRDSEDLAQEVLMFARAHVQDVRDPAKLEGWLRAIAVRKTYRLKSRRTSVQLGAEEMVAPVETDLPIDVAVAIARLPARERAVLTLVHGLGYSQADAAEALGIRRGTVAAALSHARAKLATWLIDYERGK
jgi:RNA polymerase sigma-70 factor (ECF subfamily)